MKKNYLLAILPVAFFVTPFVAHAYAGILSVPAYSVVPALGDAVQREDIVETIVPEGDFSAFHAVARCIQNAPDEIVQIPDTLIEQGRVRTAVSPDGKLHVFSFDLFAPGSIQQFQNIIQYQDKGQVSSFLGPIDRMALDDRNGADLNDGANIDCIRQVQLPTGRALYLLSDCAKISFDDVCRSLFGYVFKNGKPEDYNCFMLEANDPNIPLDELKQNHIYVCYSENALAESDLSPEAGSRVLSLDPEGLKVYQAEIEDRRLTGRYIIYQFDGKHFQMSGRDGGYWLHPSLRCYKSMELNVRTSKFQIRIDRLNDNSLRYACWSADAQQSSRPDLILYDGKEDFHTNLIYEFHSGPVRYQIYDTEGYRFLRVCQGEKVLVEQDIE